MRQWASAVRSYCSPPSGCWRRHSSATSTKATTATSSSPAATTGHEAGRRQRLAAAHGPLHADPAQVAADGEHGAAGDGQEGQHRAGAGDVERLHELAHGHAAGEQAEGGADPRQERPLVGQREAVVGLDALARRRPATSVPRVLLSSGCDGSHSSASRAARPPSQLADAVRASVGADSWPWPVSDRSARGATASSPSTVLGGSALALAGLIGTPNRDEAFEAKQVTVDAGRRRRRAHPRGRRRRLRAATDRHGYQRIIPNDFGVPTDVEASLAGRARRRLGRRRCPATRRGSGSATRTRRSPGSTATS